MILYFIVSVLLWLIAAGCVRLTGQYLFNTQHPFFILLLLATIPIVYSVTYSLYHAFHFTQEKKEKAAGIVFPLLMLLELPLIAYWKTIFPNMTESAMLTYTSYFLGFYAMCILTVRFQDPIRRIKAIREDERFSLVDPEAEKKDESDS